MKLSRTLPLATVVFAVCLLSQVALRSESESSGDSTQTVSVAKARLQDVYKEVSIQAEFRPYQEAELDAKVTGYLQTIGVDFGDKVKAGQVLATLEVPELTDELNQASASERNAEAMAVDAGLTFHRLQKVNQTQPNLVAQQDIDTAEAKSLAADANVAEKKAEVQRFQTLVEYTRIAAPFDGVVTSRYVDPGALVKANASPILRISENRRLRLDFPVPAEYSPQIKKGDEVTVKVEGGSDPVKAVITRFTDRIELSTRTMETEVEVQNPGLKLIPGEYATVVLRIGRHPGALTVPVAAVSTGAEPTVFALDSDNRVVRKLVRLGIEMPNDWEILSGINESDRVVVGNRAGLNPGDRVEPKTIEPDSP